MESLGKRLRNLRTKLDKTQQEIANLLNVNRVAYTQYENDKRMPTPETLKKLSEIFNVSVDYLLGNTVASTEKKELPSLTQKDEREIARDLQNMIDSLDGAAAMGDAEDDEDRELLRASLETAMRLSKRIAKKKFTPKKCRKE